MSKSRFLNGAEASRQYGVLAGTCAASLMWDDPLADDAAEALHRFPADWWPMVLKALDEGIDRVPGAPPELGALLASLPSEPTAEQWTAMDAGVAAIARTGGGAGLVLQCASLLTDFWSPPAARPLLLASTMTRQTVNRFAQTAAWWIEIHRPGGMRRKADGFKATLRLRLIHAFMRRLARGSGAWDRAAWGEPVNQGDLFFRVICFSKAMVDGLERMGHRLGAAEKDGYYAFWRHTAAVLGLHKTYVEMINPEDCSRFWHLWLLTNPPPDSETAALARQTLDALAGGASGFRHAFLRATTYKLFGWEVGQGLKLPWTQQYHLVPVLYLLSRLSGGDRDAGLQRAIASLSVGSMPEWLEALARFEPVPRAA